MAETSNDLMNELLKRMHHDMSELPMDVSETKKELNVIRGHMIGIQTDIHNIYGILARYDDRLDLRELAERPQAPREPPTL